MKKIICIGSATKDIFLDVSGAKLVDNKEDLTAQQLMGFEFGAKIYAQGYREEVGGSAVNCAAGLQKLDIRPFVFSRVSLSVAGKWITKQIGAQKVKKNYLQKNGKVESQISVIVNDVDHDDHVIFRTGDSVEKFNVPKALDKFREKVDLVYVASQKKGWDEDFPVISDFIKQKKAVLALNPSGYQITNGTKELVEFLAQVDVLLVNRDEAIEIIQNKEGKVEDKIDFLFEKLFSYGVKNVSITDGSKGAYASDGKEIYFTESIKEKEKIVDTVGAGDAFTAGFLASFVEKPENIQQSLQWGMANSQGTIQKIGATNGQLTKKEIKYQNLKITKLQKV